MHADCSVSGRATFRDDGFREAVMTSTSESGEMAAPVKYRQDRYHAPCFVPGDDVVRGKNVYQN